MNRTKITERKVPGGKITIAEYAGTSRQQLRARDRKRAYEHRHGTRTIIVHDVAPDGTPTGMHKETLHPMVLLVANSGARFKGKPENAFTRQIGGRNSRFGYAGYAHGGVK